MDRQLAAVLAIACVLVLISSALAASSPVLLKIIVDHLASPGVTPTGYVAIGFLVGGYTGSQWVIRLIGELRTLAIGRADQRLHRRLSSRLVNHLMSLPLRFHLDLKAGAVSQILTNGLVGYRLIVQHVVITVLPVVLELSMIGAVLSALEQPMFLGIIGASLTCYAVAFVAGAISLTEPARAVSAAQINANALLTESIQNFETVKYFCAEPIIDRRITCALGRTERSWTEFFSRKARNGALVATVFGLSLATSVYIAARNVQLGHMSLGDFVLVNSYMLQIFRPLEMLGFAFRDIAQGVVFIEKMMELFQHKPEPVPANDRVLPSGSGELIFDQVSLSYDRQGTVLHNVSFRLPAGKTVAVVGASGSGKSSLVRLLVRFYEPDSGRILLDSALISEVSMSSLRGAIAVVPQDILLFDDTIAYNIAIGRTSISAAEITHAARLAEIHDMIVARPDGYETVIGERGVRLSGGEKQRIAIARAVLRRPRVLAFDEATSSLDSRMERQILRNLAAYLDSTSKLVIAHRLAAIIDADEILVLDKGTVIDRGTHDALLRCSVVYQAMWFAQQRKGSLERHS